MQLKIQITIFHFFKIMPNATSDSFDTKIYQYKTV